MACGYRYGDETMNTNPVVGLLPVDFTKAIKRMAFLLAGVLLSLCFMPCGTADAREIVDMAGRKVALPETIHKVFVPSPYGSYIVYSIDPSLLISFRSPDKEYKSCLNKAVHDLPDIGRLSGPDRQSGMEAVMRAKPDIVMMWSTSRSIAKKTKEKNPLNQLSIPTVYVVAESINDYPDIYLFLGKLLGKEKRTRQLSAYFRNTLLDAEKVVDPIPGDKRPSVYYAEEADGLITECNDSIHVELLQLAGDVDVHRCHTSCHKGMEKISLDQLLRYDPDVILVRESAFYSRIMKTTDPAWQGLKAVREGRVYIIPRAPFNWFDRPPSFMRIMGLKWLLNCLYPDHYKIDIVSEAREFYQLFLNVDVSEADMQRIIFE